MWCPPRFQFWPKLFIVYVSDMCNISKLVKYILFADDINIFYTNHINRLNETVYIVLDKMYSWFAVNKLTYIKLIICYLEIVCSEKMLI